MKISKYLGYILKDFLTVFGALMVMSAIYLSVYSIETISTTILYQLMLAAGAFTFFKYTFANKYELSKKAQLISFSVCFILADLMILAWLFFFSPGKIMDRNLILAYLVVILVVKGAVYAMMYINGKAQAKQLNEKLREFSNNGIE